jgi:hypothetical protein
MEKDEEITKIIEEKDEIIENRRKRKRKKRKR